MISKYTKEITRNLNIFDKNQEQARNQEFFRGGDFS